MRVDVEIGGVILHSSDRAEVSSLREALAAELAGPIGEALASRRGAVVPGDSAGAALRAANEIASRLDLVLR